MLRQTPALRCTYCLESSVQKAYGLQLHTIHKPDGCTAPCVMSHQRSAALLTGMPQGLTHAPGHSFMHDTQLEQGASHVSVTMTKVGSSAAAARDWQRCSSTTISYHHP